MKVSAIVSVALAAVFASAQTTIPTCAQSCVTSSIPANCNLDPACICASADFITGISCCVFNACDTADQQATLAYAHTICDPVGLGGSLPAEAGCSDTASNSTTSASGTGGAATTGSDTATATSNTASEGSSSTETSASESTSGSESTTSEAASGASGQATESSTGAAPQHTLGMIGAGLLGLAALL